MKKLYPGKTLADIFRVAFADRLFEAKKNFIESSAAYSLVVYFLQVKDRHNGNLMLLTSGHVVHIDFGFMLSNSPGGNMAFENSPFKLTQEILDVMDGECSEQYEYFRTLLIRGFLEARKHMDRIVLQVRMMLTGSKMPCFREGADFVLSTLQDRFFCNLTEEACILANPFLEKWAECECVGCMAAASCVVGQSEKNLWSCHGRKRDRPSQVSMVSVHVNSRGDYVPISLCLLVILHNWAVVVVILARGSILVGAVSRSSRKPHNHWGALVAGGVQTPLMPYGRREVTIFGSSHERFKSRPSCPPSALRADLSSPLAAQGTRGSNLAASSLPPPPLVLSAAIARRLGGKL
ncbi:pikD [Symbiodinium necroappetens]|uniref:PikD protein n=1 Tax=Symbiodinium necroappetens TaxID=1628268 RepID=A0A812VM84_9DINO|nr:pikD [Symbiodinium necroappetens]